MNIDILTSLYVFMLAAFIGFEVIRRVSPLLHTPLMSLTNALDAIAVVGAIILVGERQEHAGDGLRHDRHRRGHEQRRGRLPHHRPHARDVQGEPPEEVITDDDPQRAHDRADLPDRHGPVHPRAQVDEFAEHGEARRPGGRAGDGPGHRRHAAAPRHRRLHVDRHRAGARHDHRRAPGHGADDGRAAADRAEPRVRRALRHARRHGRILPAGARGAAVHDGGAGAGGHPRLAHVHGQLDGRGEAAGGPAATAASPTRGRTSSTCRCSPWPWPWPLTWSSTRARPGSSR